MRRAFTVIRPRRIVLVEAEVWPNLVALARRQRIPMALVSARLSPRSERRFFRFRRVFGPIFAQLSLIGVPEHQDIERWVALGADRTSIHQTGSIKYDPADSSVAKQIARASVFAIDHLVLLGGSTHRGEEQILAEAFLRLRTEFPSLRLFLAPRHVERCSEILKELEALGLTVQLASDVASAAMPRPDCVLLDQTGELQSWYGVATVAFVGKSLIAHGGQNPVEPIAAGVPVVFGSHMENFASLAKELVENQGAIQVSTAAELERELRLLLRDGPARRRLVANAGQVLSAHRGATERTARLLVGLRAAN